MIFFILFILNYYATFVSKQTGDLLAFGFDMENNIPTYFSAILCYLIATICLVRIFYNDIINKTKIALGSIGLAFAYVGTDEIMAIHETFVEKVNKYYKFDGLLHFSWVIPGFIFLLSFVAINSFFYLSFSKKSQVRLTIALFVYISGAILMEMISGYTICEIGDANSLYKAMTTAEESLEMLGLILFVQTIITSKSKT